MKKTLLEIVQNILSEMDSDEVNTLDDTVESQQVAQIAKSCYYEMLGNRNWPHMRKLVQLDASNDLNRPNYLKLPDNLKEMISFNYETQKITDSKIILTELKYKEPEDFLRFVSQRDSSKSNVKTVTDFSGTKLLVLNDIAPTYWTSFDDVNLVTDSYDSVIDDTLKRSKSQCIAYIVPSWLQEDDFVPDLPIDAFPAFEEEVKSTAFFVLKQMTNQKAEQKVSRQNRWLSRKAWRAHGGIQYEDFGRKNRR